MKSIERITEELVEFQTVEGNKREFEKCLSYIEDQLNSDLNIERFEKEGDKSLLIKRGEDPQILLHGHIDVVQASENLFEPKVSNGRIYGRGAADMKSGVACMIDVINEVGSPGVALLLTSDEERGGFNGTGYVIEERGLSPELVISGEPDDSGSFPSIVTTHKGVLQLELMTEGKSAHASKPGKGDNAAEKLLQKYIQFRDNFDHEADFPTTINLGNIKSEGPVNQIPDSASLQVDIRYSRQYPRTDIMEDLNAIQGLNYEIIAEGPMMDISENSSMVQALGDSVQNFSCEKPVFRNERFSSDMRFFTEKNVPAVCFGPEGYNLHGEEEYVEIASLTKYCDILKNLIERNLE